MLHLLGLFHQSLKLAEDYSQKLNEICRKQGIIEGDCINDFYSGRLLRKIDFADEDGFDEQGFKVVTNQVIEKDIYEHTLTAQEQKTKIIYGRIS
jgi:hypothetical protein